MLTVKEIQEIVLDHCFKVNRDLNVFKEGLSNRRTVKNHKSIKYTGIG